MVKFEINGKEMQVKIVCKHGNGAMAYAPKAWIGKKVIMILEGS